MGLAALFAGWFINDKHWLATQLVLRAVALRHCAAPGLAQDGFLGPVLALGWFSHGVMSAWSHPQTRWLALIEITPALLVIFSASSGCAPASASDADAAPPGRIICAPGPAPLHLSWFRACT